MSLVDDEERSTYNIIIDKGEQIYERLENNIANLNTNNSTLIGIILATLSVTLTLILFLIQNGWNPSNIDTILLKGYVLFSIIALGINIYIFHPTDYKDIEVFEPKRFEELRQMKENELLSDHLYWLRDAFNFNSEKYNKRIKLFVWGFRLFLVSIMTFILLLIKNLITMVN